jgi:hypothetical protein
VLLNDVCGRLEVQVPSDLSKHFEIEHTAKGNPTWGLGLASGECVCNLHVGHLAMTAGLFQVTDFLQQPHLQYIQHVIAGEIACRESAQRPYKNIFI